MEHVVEPPADREAARGSSGVEAACGKAAKGGFLAGVDATQGTEETCGGPYHDEVVHVEEELLHAFHGHRVGSCSGTNHGLYEQLDIWECVRGTCNCSDLSLIHI